MIDSAEDLAHVRQFLIPDFDNRSRIGPQHLVAAVVGVHVPLVDLTRELHGFRPPDVRHRDVPPVVWRPILERLLLQIENDVPIIRAVDSQSLERDIEGRDPLLTVEDERYVVRVAHGGNSQVHQLAEQVVVPPLGIPEEERSDRELVIDAVKKLPHLRLRPDVLPLELGYTIPSRLHVGDQVHQLARLDLDLPLLTIRSRHCSPPPSPIVSAAPGYDMICVSPTP